MTQEVDLQSAAKVGCVVSPCSSQGPTFSASERECLVGRHVGLPAQTPVDEPVWGLCIESSR